MKTPHRLAPAALLLAAGPVLTQAQGVDVPVVTPQDTVRAVDPGFPKPGADNDDAASPETSMAATEMRVLQSKVAALETRVRQLEELVRRMGVVANAGAIGVAGPAGVAGPGAEGAGAGGQAYITEGDPAVAATGVTEEEVQASLASQERIEQETAETREGFRDMQDEQRRETQEEIRNRINNARRGDDDGVY